MSRSNAGVRSKVHQRRQHVVIAAVCLIVVMGTACGRGGDSTAASQSASTATATASPGPASASATQIVIDGFRFGDKTTIPAGAQVTVVNKDSAEHTVTSDTAGVFDTEVKGNAQATFTAPSSPGSYAFHCTYHPSMHGVLVVQ
jgi:plastocyanin